MGALSKKIRDITFESFLAERLKEGPPFKVLVIEDNELVLKVIEIRLKNKGAKAYSLTNSQKAKKLILEEKIDLLIFNIEMGEAIAKDFLKEVRNIYSPMQLPIIVMAPKEKEDKLVEYLKLGANDFLTTPINFTISWARIQTLATIKRFYETIEQGRRDTIKSASMMILLEMTRNIAHEINNPLMIITGKLEKIRMDILQGKKINHEIDEVERFVLRADEVIQNLLTFSKDETLTKPGPVQFNELIKKVKVICQSTLTANGINFILVEKDDNLVLRGKEGELTQILFNLIMNSVREISQDNNPFIEVRIEKQDNKALIKITDSGKGIPVNIRDVIFQPYFTTSQSGFSIGMGLPLAKDIIERNGGRIYLNDKAENTQFVIELSLWKLP